jgi:hypothetical protein
MPEARGRGFRIVPFFIHDEAARLLAVAEAALASTFCGLQGAFCVGM